MNDTETKVSGKKKKLLFKKQRIITTNTIQIKKDKFKKFQ